MHATLPYSPAHRPKLAARRLQRAARARGWLCSLAATVLLSACGGGGDSSSSVATASPAIPVLSMAPGTATVVLPSGVSIGTDRLTVRSSVGEATPNAAGAVTLNSYVDGEQLAIVLSPAGNPMLMGCIDATHTTLSAATTAQVLAYFALNGSLMLNDAERQALMADLPSAPGIDALTSVVQSELARSVDAFAQADPALTQALATFASATYGSARMAAAATRAHPLGISITPATQSSIDVLQDPPFAAHLTNSFRRRAYAFVDRVSHTTGRRQRRRHRRPHRHHECVLRQPGHGLRGRVGSQRLHSAGRRLRQDHLPGHGGRCRRFGRCCLQPYRSAVDSTARSGDARLPQGLHGADAGQRRARQRRHRLHRGHRRQGQVHG